MSGDFVHSIFCQQDGDEFARRIKDIFAGKRYNVEFNIHKLESANATNISNTGLSILLLTSAICDFIRSGRHPDLNVLFHNPDFSIAIIFCVERTKVEITTLLSSRIMDFDKWTMLEFKTESGLTPVIIDIMAVIEKLENPILQKFRVWTPDGVKPHQQVILIFTMPVDDDLQVKVIQKWDGLKTMAERLNPMTYIFSIGAVEPGDRSIEVFVNETSYGRAVLHVLPIEPKMEQIAECLDGVINPIEHLCQCLHIVHATRDNLDRKLVDLLSKNTSSVSHITEEFNWESYGDSNSNLELPTLLHFGAKYGLRLFCLELLKLPGGKHALKIKNKCGLLPHQIALKEGFEHLELILWRNEKEDIYVKLKSPSGLKGQNNFHRSETLQVKGRATPFLNMSMRETRSPSINALHPSPLSRTTVDRIRIPSDSEIITKTTPSSEEDEISPEPPQRLHRKMTKVTSVRDEGQKTVDIDVKPMQKFAMKGQDNIHRSETLSYKGHGTPFLNMSMRETRSTSFITQRHPPLSRTTVDRIRVHSDSEIITKIAPEPPQRLHRKMTKVTSVRGEGQQTGIPSRLLIHSVPELGRIMRKERPYDTIEDL